MVEGGEKSEEMGEEGGGKWGRRRLWEVINVYGLDSDDCSLSMYLYPKSYAKYV